MNMSMFPKMIRNVKTNPLIERKEIVTIRLTWGVTVVARERRNGKR